MTGGPRIAIDAMGGDAGATAMVAGAARAQRRDPALQFLIYGDEREVREQLDAHPKLKPAVTVCHSRTADLPSVTR